MDALLDTFHFSAGPFEHDAFRVLSFTGEEAISELYAIEVVLEHPDDPLFAESLETILLGQPATLAIDLATGATRRLKGVIGGFRVGRAPTRDECRTLEVTLVPKLWLLTRRIHSRIFQERSVREIVDVILEGWGVRHEWRIARALPRRPYCVQYCESDLAFVKRLLAEEGIFFFFEHTEGPTGAIAAAASVALHASLSGSIGISGNVEVSASVGIAGELSLASSENLVLAEDATAYRPIQHADDGLAGLAASVTLGAGGAAVRAVAHEALQPALALRPDATALLVEEASIQEFFVSREVGTKSALLSDYDFRRPRLVQRSRAHASGRVDVGAAALASTSSIPPSLQADIAPHLRADQLQAYFHHDRAEYESSSSRVNEVDDERARTTLEQLRARVHVGRGESVCRRLAPGHTFALEDHPVDRLNRGYLVTRVFHEGRISDLGRGEVNARPYASRFECVPDHVPFRPPVPPRREQTGTETATVMGPRGEDIWVDHYGRIKVQFHWDLDGRAESSTCWIRVVQAWAGSGFGAQFVPRVGTEVAVTFLGGDPDRPVVTGCLHNTLNPQPFELPAKKTRSGFRTQSTRGGGGYNEISFEDAEGGEQLYVHAQRDFDELVERNRSSVVKNDVSLSAGGSRAESVGGDHALTVRGAVHEEVHGDRRRSAGGASMDIVEGNADARVGGDSHARIGGRERREILASQETIVKDDLTVRTKGCHTTLVGAADAKRSSLLHVEGTARIESTDLTEIGSDKVVELRCGKSVIRISEHGIEFSANTIVLNGNLKVRGDEAEIVTQKRAEIRSKVVKLRSEEAAVVLDHDAKLRGRNVQLQCKDEEESDADTKSKTEPTVITLVDAKGAPIPYRRYFVRRADGSEESGFVGADGRVELAADAAGSVVFPDLHGTESA